MYKEGFALERQLTYPILHKNFSKSFNAKLVFRFYD